MDCINIDEYTESQTQESELIDVDERPFYFKRELNVCIKFVKNYLKELNTLIEKAPLEEKLRLSAHKMEIEKELQLDREYTPYLNNIKVDELNTLEMIGAPSYAKNYQNIYSISNFVDVILAFMCNEDYDLIHNNLERNLKKFGISYSTFSKGVCSQNEELLNRIPLGVFVGICDKLDSHILYVRNNYRNIKLNFHRVTYIPSLMNMDEFATIKYDLYSNILEIARYILDGILLCYRDDNARLEPNNKMFMTSVGLDNVVIQSNLPNMCKPIILSCEVGTYRLEPICVRKGDLLSYIMEV